jgi:hypothetical protein
MVGRRKTEGLRRKRRETREGGGKRRYEEGKRT